jgi:hypothetical protein
MTVMNVHAESSAVGSVQIGLVRDEILTDSKPAISVDVPPEADPKYVARAVGVLGVDGQVNDSGEEGHYRWAPRTVIAPGRYKLVVGALVDKNSRRISAPQEIPFMVVATRAEIPEGVRIESFVRLRLHERGIERLSAKSLPEGEYIDLIKATSRRGDKPVALSFDQDGKEVDGEALIAEHQMALAAKFGKVHPTLYETAERLDEQYESLLVDVWYAFEEDEPSEDDRPTDAREVEKAHSRAQEKQQLMVEQNQKFAQVLGEYGDIVIVDEAAPLVTMWLPPANIPELAARDDVAGLFLHEVEGIEDLGNSIDIAGSDVVHAAGQMGQYIRVAVWENGPTDNDDLVIFGTYDGTPPTSDHSQNVHAIIRNKEAGSPNGHAPLCKLFSANSKKREALTWAVKDEDCTIINQSFHRPSEPGSDLLSSDDIYGDWLAVHWPYPLVVHAAGNFWEDDPDDIDPPSDEYVNHKGYNTLSVGNHNDDASAMYASSVFRNPTSPHGDRELPEISANGTWVTADGLTFLGTSQASPAVAGIAALLQGASSVLEYWPEGCRAILLASTTRNVRDDTWWQDASAGTDARDGAGAVNAAEAYQVAQNPRWRDAEATRRGWHVGLLTSSDFGAGRMSTFEYKVSVPNLWYGPQNVKVALAWTSKITMTDAAPSGSNLTVDLDIKIYDSDGTQVGYSGSWDNSYEIAEFVGNPGETYTIKIRRWSGSDSTWYGIAWTVTGGLRWALPLEEYVLERAMRRIG